MIFGLHVREDLRYNLAERVPGEIVLEVPRNACRATARGSRTLFQFYRGRQHASGGAPCGDRQLANGG